jgi:putative transposase
VIGPIAAKVLARQFDAAGHNQRWVGDTTEFFVVGATAKLYLAAILDLYSVHFAPASSSTGLSAP